MAYVDLNPVRAKICNDIADYEHTSIYQRLECLEASPEKLQEFLTPLVSGIGAKTPVIAISLQDYIQHLHWLSPANVTASSQIRSHRSTDKRTIWFNRVASIKKRQLAYGLKDELLKWTQRHGWKRPGDALV